MKRVFFTCLIVLTTASCSSKWERTGNLSEDYDMANLDCQRISQNAYPVRNEVAHETVYKPHIEFCEKKKECDGKKYKMAKSPEIRSYPMDVNEISRNQSFESCMKKRGWKRKLLPF